MSPVVPTAYASRPQTTPAAPTRGLRTMLATVFVAPFRKVRNRRSAASLLHLDPHLLADIGLTQGDIRDALRSYASDPADTLRLLAETRRDQSYATAQARLGVHRD